MRMSLFFVYLILLLNPFALFTLQLSDRWHPHLSNVSDQQALLGFMSAVSTQSLPTDWNWNPNVSFCRWSGITCSVRRQRVVSLDVSSMGLEGTISPLLGNLSFLRILDIHHNSFHGPIPYQLGSLFRLRMLILYNNKLQGSIPPTLGGCRSLTNFTTSTNNLRGTIPSELCVLPSLRYIDLKGNYLKGPIPACLGNISSLVHINFSLNNLHGCIPSELGMLSLVRKIELFNTSMTGQIPSSLSNCTNLRSLELGYNKLTGHIPSELCTKHSQLIGLFLLENNLNGGIPASIFNCTKLQVIELAYNQFSGVVPMEFGKLTELRGLYLNNNQLVSSNTTSLPVLTALTNCSRLEAIVFSSNLLMGTLSFSIGHLSKKLKNLYLGDNGLAGKIPPEIGNLTNLTSLQLEWNYFTGAIPSSLNMLQKLERLYLGTNNLQGNIPTDIGQLKSLGLLALDSNNLSGRIPDSLASLHQLSYLHLEYNQLSGNIPETLWKCVNLLLLDLSNNKLSGYIPPEVAGLANLAFYFNLSNNLLHGPLPSSLSKMTMLQALDISANRLTGDIPSTLSSCEALEYLNLSCNTLEGPIPNSLYKLQNLQDMDFSSNNLVGGIPLSFDKLKMLKHLNFSFNNLSGEVPKDGVFKNLNATAFMGNVHLCGSWVRLPPCSSRKDKSHLHLKRVIITVVTVTTLVGCLFLGILWRSQNCRRLATRSLDVGHQNRVSYEELMIATDGFSDANLLGIGSFGKVYKGVMKDGILVAVKLFNPGNEEANKSFNRECNVLRRVRHRNLIKIITSYSDLQFKALIFPFMSKGSLEKWLYANGEEYSNGLSLIQRLNIAIDIAHGMEYLHHYCFVQVIHCDLKPTNVLVGEDMTAYLIDFGIATICFETFDNTAFTSTHALKGSTGYIPPEYGLGLPVTTKGDVYSYGIMLLELLTGKKPTDNMFVEGMTLRKWVLSGFPDQVPEVVNKTLLRRTSMTNTEEDKELSCISQLISLGLFCTIESPSERPNMMEIVGILQIIRDTFLGTAENPRLHSDIYTLLAGTSTTSNNAHQSQSSSTF